MTTKTKQIVAAAVLCAAASTALGQQAGVPQYGPLREPVPVPGAKPLSIAGIDALKGDGMYYIYGPRVVNLRASDTPGQGNRHALTENSNDAKTSAVNGHLDVGNFVLNGERRAVGRPNFAIPAPDGSVYLVYSGDNPLRVAVTVQGFDVSDMPIQPFLRTPDNYPKQEAGRAGSARFPANSIAYLLVARFVDDVLMLPVRESFTGATDTSQFVGNFSKQIPYCLSYEDRNGAKPYAMFFKGGAKQGPVQLYPAKTGTLFCDRTSNEVAAEGRWEERTIAGTKAVVLSFPANVDPLDTGVSNVERESARIAFIQPTRGTPGVRPGKLYQAGAKVFDFQYRFNKTAADAVRQAIGLQ
jgi:hypothetical protein